MDWYLVESYTRPKEIDTDSSHKYNYVRTQITESIIEDGITKYFYKEAKILKEYWGLYLDLLQAQADIDYLTMITEGL